MVRVSWRGSEGVVRGLRLSDDALATAQTGRDLPPGKVRTITTQNGGHTHTRFVGGEGAHFARQFTRIWKQGTLRDRSAADQAVRDNQLARLASGVDTKVPAPPPALEAAMLKKRK